MATLPEDPPSPVTAETIWHKHREFIRKWLCRLRVRDQDLDDVLQDVFKEIIESLHTFDPQKGALRGWLFRITERQAQHYRERLWATAALLAAAPKTTPTNPEDSTLSHLLVDKLMQKIKPEKRRLVFVAYALHDMTVEEICDGFSISENTARTWIRRSSEDFHKAFNRHQTELSRIGAAPLAFSAFALLDLARRELGSIPGDVGAEPLGEPTQDGEPPVSGRNPRDGWTSFDFPRPGFTDPASHVGSFIAGAAAMFALLRLVPSHPSEPIEPDRSAMVMDSSLTVTQPVPAKLPTLTEAPRATPANSTQPATVPNAPLAPVVGTSRASVPAEEDESLIRGAEAACARGDSDRAQFLVDHHAEEFPNSRFASERERIRALFPCMRPPQAK